MRVTYFHYIHNSPGSVVQINEFARAFRARGHEINVHGMDEPQSLSNNPPSVKTQAKKFVEPFFHEMNSLRKDWACIKKECGIAEKERPELILARYKLYSNSAARVSERFHLPFVAWVHAPALYEKTQYGGRFFRIPGLAEWTERRILKKADRLILVSEELKQHLLSRRLVVRAQKAAVIPNGVDPEKFSPERDGQRIRAQFPIANPVVLGFVGSFSPWHGMRSLKEIMGRLLGECPNSCFLFVGEGRARGEMETFVRAGGWDPLRVHFTGQVEHSEVPRHIAAMDVCLLPYDQEAESFYFSPLKLFEYLASGKAVLAPRMGQIEKVIQEGVNGMLYASSSLEEALRKLKQLISDPFLRRRLGEGGRRTVLENYTWGHTARLAEAVFKNVLEERQKTS